METPTPEPYLTLRFYRDGHTETIAGPDRFPTEPDAIQKAAGGVLIMLWQIGDMAFRRFLALSIARTKLDDILASFEDPGKPN